MDLDMLVMQAMDPVFSSRSPFSAVFRGSKEMIRPWKNRPARTYYDARQQFQYGVNGGLFCVWPDNARTDGRGWPTVARAQYGAETFLQP